MKENVEVLFTYHDLSGRYFKVKTTIKKKEKIEEVRKFKKGWVFLHQKGNIAKNIYVLSRIRDRMALKSIFDGNRWCEPIRIKEARTYSWEDIKGVFGEHPHEFFLIDGKIEIDLKNR
ncbi:MAG: hypothetical protein GWP09_00415 [Nitrospiraceae bacterium]|nr:hypothetical protein [Nitrospiraceae bacterium]